MIAVVSCVLNDESERNKTQRHVNKLKFSAMKLLKKASSSNPRINFTEILAKNFSNVTLFFQGVNGKGKPANHKICRSITNRITV